LACDDVGNNALVLVSKERPRAAVTGLHLIEHEQPAALVAELAQLFEKAGGEY